MVARRRLSDTERGRALALLNEGYGVVEVGRRLGVTWSVVGRLRDRFNQTGTVRERQRSGRPSVLKRKISRRKACAMKVKCGDIYSQRASLARAFHFTCRKGLSLHSDTSEKHAVLRVFSQSKVDQQGR